ncbi:hypothetical protein BHM03_00042019 [Ensete ventricosum]|nr:hypothetical protein BHM03_00042019 [Ensete ventricosum]
MRANDTTAITVRGYLALTSHRISGLSPSINVPNSCFSDQSRVWFERHSNLL